MMLGVGRYFDGLEVFEELKSICDFRELYV
jgi:hypothetical protein